MSPRDLLIPAWALLIWSSALADVRPAGQRSQTDLRIPIPFFQVQELQVSGKIAVGLYSALTGQSFLYAVDLESQREVVRINDVGRTPFAFDGAHIFYSRGASVTELDVESRVTRQLWNGVEGQTIRTIHVEGSRLSLVSEAADGIRVVRLDITNGSESATPALAPAGDVSDAFLSSTTAIVLLQDGRAFVSRSPGAWTPLPGDDVTLLGLAGSHAIAVRSTFPDTLLQADLSVDGAPDWRDLYTIAGRRAIRPIATGDGQAISFVEGTAAASNPFGVLWLPLGGVEVEERRVLPVRVPVDERARVAWTRDRVAWSERLDGRLFLLWAPLSAPAESMPSARSISSEPALEGSAARGIQWLTRQLGPSFVSRHGRTARLLDSYEDGERAGWIYDAAVASTAFTASGRSATAAELLAGLEHLQGEDGSWFFAYDPDRGVPQGNDRYVGSMAWVVMAANFYEWDTGDRQFAPMANRALTYLEQFRVADTGSDLYGGFTMGPNARTVVSTEHNADCYAAFHWRGRLDENMRAQAIASDVHQFVMRRAWMGEADNTTGPFFKVGAAESTLYLDAQTWTALAFGDRIPTDMRQRALQTAENALTVTDGKFRDVQSIVGLDDTVHPRGSAKVWAEGSEGMVAALTALGTLDRARQYHLQTARYQRESGGIPYATENGGGWSTAESAAATAWFVLNELSPPRNPFDPGWPPRP